MPRPIKEGLNYFPLDCDFLSDEKVISVKVNYGAKGVAILIALLCAIYRQGYFALWNESLALKIANDLPGVSVDLVGKVVELLSKFGFFDKALLEAEGVLTSIAIQRRFLVGKKNRRDIQNLPYWMVMGAKTPVMGAKTPVMGDFMHQSKVNKSKEKESVKEKAAAEAAATHTQDNSLKFFKKPRGTPANGVEEDLHKGKCERAPGVWISDAEHSRFVEAYGSPDTDRLYALLSDYKAAHGKEYRSDAAAIRQWVVDRLAKERRQQLTSQVPPPTSDAARVEHTRQWLKQIDQKERRQQAEQQSQTPPMKPDDVARAHGYDSFAAWKAAQLNNNP